MTDRGKRRLGLWIGLVLVAVVAIAAAVLFALNNKQPATAEGDCVNGTDVVTCDKPHDAKIVEIVNGVNDCPATATHNMKDRDGRYLCLVEETQQGGY